MNVNVNLVTRGLIFFCTSEQHELPNSNMSKCIEVQTAIHLIIPQETNGARPLPSPR